MLNKSILLLSVLIILFVHFKVINYLRVDKEVIIAQEPVVNNISIRRVLLKQKEHKEVKPILEKEKVVEAKKIVKKAIKKTTKKKIVKKEKIVKKTTPKMKQSVTEKIVKIAPKKTTSTAVKNSIENEYLLKIRAEIEKNKQYPKMAKRLKQQGKVIVRFLITKHGFIESITLKNGCPYKRLNIAAIELLEKIKKFDPIPSELNKGSWVIDIPITYSIINT